VKTSSKGKDRPKKLTLIDQTSRVTGRGRGGPAVTRGGGGGGGTGKRDFSAGGVRGGKSAPGGGASCRIERKSKGTKLQRGRGAAVRGKDKPWTTPKVKWGGGKKKQGGKGGVENGGGRREGMEEGSFVTGNKVFPV